MYIPDLFGSYEKGREYAIDKNWQDLIRYEQVEQMRNNNDAQQLALLKNRAQFGGSMNMFQNQVDNSARANEVAEYAQPGMVSRADLGSMYAQDQRGVYLNNRDTARNVMDALFAAQLGRQGVATQALMGQNDYYNTGGRAYNMGQMQGNIGFQGTNANNVAANNAVNAMQQQIDQSNMNYRNNVAGGNLAYAQLQNAQALLPAQQQLAQSNIGNQQWAADQYIAGKTLLQQQANANAASNTLASVLKAAREGNKDAILWLQQRGLLNNVSQGVPATGVTLLPQGTAGSVK